MASRASFAQAGRTHPSRTARSQRCPIRSKALDWSANSAAGQVPRGPSSTAIMASQSGPASSPRSC
eukprot:12568434-Alexandrium_andersonii.AAC.1